MEAVTMKWFTVCIAGVQAKRDGKEVDVGMYTNVYQVEAIDPDAAENRAIGIVTQMMGELGYDSPEVYVVATFEGKHEPRDAEPDKPESDEPLLAAPEDDSLLA